ncbi:acyl-CoA dehydrogenase [Paracoccus pantotrophus]|uniref:Acyl-CoA dehydrogenase n=1 Tax=Paracoccus pantotrophus TaxID=82367 RepID=A0A7H9BY34_PARPN|nr:MULTISPECIES: acyl-CoA dehydrogenase family protein [Paracoccus]QLH16103.1 acyl-CoA dehydrogenase [Paracoccus pantotrophus]UFM65955.1 hypothetical protein LOS78_08360 [Paracoccus sp. MA]
MTRHEVPTDPFATIAARAGAADRAERDLSDDIRLLFDCGVMQRLCDCATGPSVARGVDLLCRLGAANLSVGRLAEGHVNALRLIRLYGAAEQIARAEHAAAQAQLFGVWGADGPRPVRIDRTADGQAVLAGAKRFCSGLGLVRHAVVTARSARGVQLVLIRADDERRHDTAQWRTAGMRATLSGGHDMEGLRGEALGQADDYMREPYFEGGIWRYAALHAGALEALADALGRHIRDPSPMQAARLVEMIRLTRGARLWVEHAANAVENSPAPDITASLLAREAVEEACLRGIALCERAFGTAAFMDGNPVERIRRDLAFFLRQANLDGKTQLAARLILDGRATQ